MFRLDLSQIQLKGALQAWKFQEKYCQKHPRTRRRQLKLTLVCWTTKGRKVSGDNETRISLASSGVHRLFEGQGRKEGHFSAFWLPKGQFGMRFGSLEGTLACILAPKRAVYHVLTSQAGSLVCFANQGGTLTHFLGSQESTLALVFQQLGHEGGATAS